LHLSHCPSTPFAFLVISVFVCVPVGVLLPLVLHCLGPAFILLLSGGGEDPDIPLFIYYLLLILLFIYFIIYYLYILI
jgi:hypothetical protein